MEIEWLILADAAQVVGNKLYVLGGGWDRIVVNTGFPVDQRCAIAVAVKVGWQETNQKHNLELEVSSEDALTEQLKSLVKVNGQFEVGRPPGIPQGQEQLIQIAVELNLRLENPGTKVITARVDGNELRRTRFNVVQGQGAAKKA